MIRGFTIVAIQLCVVSETPRFGEVLGTPRQELFEARVAFAEYALVQKAKDSNIAPQFGRREIEFQAGLLGGDVQFLMKVSLHLIHF